MNSKEMPIEEYKQIFNKHDSVADLYLEHAYKRMCITKKLALQGICSTNNNIKLLDIGSHMLHSSVLYAMDGIKVDAADLTSYASDKIVQGVLKDYKINFLTYNDLSNPIELNILPSNYYDIILFSEILEHITFNPVKMWETIYRLLSPKGKIIVTTPNYYSTGNIINNLLQLLQGMSSGIPITQIISLNTTAHHWKLYSEKDLITYFQLLSPDFIVKRIVYYNYSTKKSIIRKIKALAEKGIKYLREALYAEIVIERKEHGIIAKPGW